MEGEELARGEAEGWELSSQEQWREGLCRGCDNSLLLKKKCCILVSVKQKTFSK